MSELRPIQSLGLPITPPAQEPGSQESQEQREQREQELKRLLAEILEKAVDGEIADRVMCLATGDQQLPLSELNLAETFHPDQKKYLNFIFSIVYDETNGMQRRGGQSMSARVALEAVLFPDRYVRGRAITGFTDAEMMEMHRAMEAASAGDKQTFMNYAMDEARPWSDAGEQRWREAFYAWGYHVQAKMSATDTLGEHFESFEKFTAYVSKLSTQVQRLLEQQNRWNMMRLAPNIQVDYPFIIAAINQCKMQIRVDEAGERAASARAAVSTSDANSATASAQPPTSNRFATGASAPPTSMSSGSASPDVNAGSNDWRKSFDQELNMQAEQALQTLAQLLGLSRPLTEAEMTKLYGREDIAQQIYGLIAAEKRKKSIDSGGQTLDDLKKRQQQDREALLQEHERKKAELQREYEKQRQRMREEEEEMRKNRERLESDFQQTQRRARERSTGAAGVTSDREEMIELLKKEDEDGIMLFNYYSNVFRDLERSWPPDPSSYRFMAHTDRLRVNYSGLFMKQYREGAMQFAKNFIHRPVVSREILEMLISVPLVSRMLVNNLVECVENNSSGNLELSLTTHLKQELDVADLTATLIANEMAAECRRNPSDYANIIARYLTDPRMTSFVQISALTTRQKLVDKALAQSA